MLPLLVSVVCFSLLVMELSALATIRLAPVASSYIKSVQFLQSLNLPVGLTYIALTRNATRPVPVFHFFPMSDRLSPNTITFLICVGTISPFHKMVRLRCQGTDNGSQDLQSHIRLHEPFHLRYPFPLMAPNDLDPLNQLRPSAQRAGGPQTVLPITVAGQSLDPTSPSYTLTFLSRS